jgi:DeoR/GlpR family transcriptional regulator of sugar metabolism
MLGFVISHIYKHFLKVSPRASKTSKPAAARQQIIRETLRKSAAVSVSSMAERLGVSEMTIRRDLEKLENMSNVRRTRGGAVVAERTVFEFTYQERQRAMQAQKSAIAHNALSLIKPGQRIILDTGTTTLHLAALLKEKDNLTVITPSLAVASELQYANGIRVVLLGGVLHRGSPDLTGPLTEHCLELLSADWAFQGAEAVGADGSVYNVDLQLAQVDRKMRVKAAKACLLVDSSKFGRNALVRNGTLSDFDIVITDHSVPDKFRRLARRMGTNLIVGRPASGGCKREKTVS